MVIFSEITENECVKEKYTPHSIAKRLVQHCAAISAIAELLFYKFTVLLFSLLYVSNVRLMCANKLTYLLTYLLVHLG